MGITPVSNVMYVSVTGLKPIGFLGWLRFWMLAIPALKAAQKAEGCLFCETKQRNGYHHTFTVWCDKTAMIKYKTSPVHLKTMKVFSQIAHGKVYGYETSEIPTWDDAIQGFDDNARTV